MPIANINEADLWYDVHGPGRAFIAAPRLYRL